MNGIVLVQNILLGWGLIFFGWGGLIINKIIKGQFEIRKLVFQVKMWFCSIIIVFLLLVYFCLK